MVPNVRRQLGKLSASASEVIEAGDARDLPKTHYIMQRYDEVESNRLDFYFQVYYKHWGFDLIVRPGVTIPTSGAILDAGTGSGSWILALSKEIPRSVSLHAIDLSSSLFRHDLAPDNVHHSVYPVTALPEDWTNKFDLVNQRQLVASLSVPAWRTNLAELYRVTKPGGNIQLAEPSSLSRVYSAGCSPESSARKFDRVLEISIEEFGYLEDVFNQLPRMVSEAGFHDICVEVKPGPRLGKKWGGEVGLDALKVNIQSISGLKNRVLEVGIVKDEKEFDELLEKYRQECEGEGYSGVEFCFVCARK
ncbi:S-adenosyl-L-methionine-dependent methyltransferase [Marasmius fiardii PR-910]|nr:S-adenosyl-L-methionine-dependent methyltransferase [Marasmius fiardii PR-910]